jgi:hypothetical protein
LGIGIEADAASIGIWYLRLVPEHSGTKLGALIVILHLFRHWYFCSLRYRTDPMPDSPAFPHLKTFYNILPAGGGKGDTLHVHTAGGDGKGYTLHCSYTAADGVTVFLLFGTDRTE